MVTRLRDTPRSNSCSSLAQTHTRTHKKDLLTPSPHQRAQWEPEVLQGEGGKLAAAHFQPVTENID